MKTGLVWFKNDLRLHDNEALCHAIAECDQLIFFHAIDPKQFKALNLGFKKAGINRFKFLEQSVLNLQNKLEVIGGHLLISANSAIEEIPSLVKEYNISVVYAEDEYASEEIQIKNEVMYRLPNVEFNFYWGKTLYHIHDIPFIINEVPLTSKAYRIAVSKESEPRTTFKAPESVLSHPKSNSTKFPSPTIYGFTKHDFQIANPFLEGGEDKALERLRFYTFESKLLTDYRWTRNRSLGLDYSSKFSPYLTLGCLSPRLIYEAVKDYELKIKKNQSTWWIVFELVWRDYFTFKAMRMGDEIFFTKGYKKKDVNFENDLDKFKRWMDGKTGIPFIDAHIRQLNQTGYMSNRGRVNCASYFVHDLNIDWTWGSAYFESKLIDYDVSANWMNWHMQAFEIYYTNPVHQSLKYNANEYIAKWIPELNRIEDNRIHAPWIFKDLSEKSEYPNPIEVYNKWSRSISRIQKTIET